MARKLGDFFGGHRAGEDYSQTRKDVRGEFRARERKLQSFLLNWGDQSRASTRETGRTLLLRDAFRGLDDTKKGRRGKERSLPKELESEKKKEKCPLSGKMGEPRRTLRRGDAGTCRNIMSG